MALPKVNETPKYELIIPSTKQKVKFRPFLMKEEKVMLMAMESENQTDILNTIMDTISVCIIDDIDISNLSTFDIEYCFLKIRGKSAGETSKISLSCKECDAENEISINLDDIKVDVPELNNKIQINDEIIVELSWPSFTIITQNETIIKSDSTVDQIFSLIRSCIVSINTEEERFSAKDHTQEELDSFIESLSAEQFGKIREYVEAMPRLTHEVKFSCANCSTDNSLTLEGMQSFFS